MYEYAGADLMLPRGKEREWLLTNGIGGFASSTISGINTRRYHGLLVAALKPPGDRRVLVSKLEEEVWIDEHRFSLFGSETVGGFSGMGFHYLQTFRRFPLPAYVYRLDDVVLEKEIWLPQGENEVQVRYRIINPNRRHVRMVVYPLLTARDYHWTLRRNEWPWRTTITGSGVMVEPYDGGPHIWLTSDSVSCSEAGFWYYDVFYAQEAARGLDAVDDLYCPVTWEFETDSDNVFRVAAAAQPVIIEREMAARERISELIRIQALTERPGFDSAALKVLAVAADQFLVRGRAGEGMSVIAGYPWFGDWGRDTMIALPGLTLPAGRYEDFRRCFRTCLVYARDGLIPNLFDDRGGDPAYNTVDASLWAFWAIYKYLQYTKDWDFVLEAAEVLDRILEHYRDGTAFGIGMDKDGLIVQGSPGHALTWMDACIHGEVITPRRGKPVEINALWHFALRFQSYIRRYDGRTARSSEWRQLSDLVKEHFAAAFWLSEKGYLADAVDDQGPVHALRCNQIIAASLPVRLLPAGLEHAVVGAVTRRLLTPFGLKTLADDHPGYSPRYQGNPEERDRAYHQGTVWVWPWGQYMTALNRTYERSEASRRLINRLIAPLLWHLEQEGLGTVSEVFDPEPPFSAGGCFAQAWSVAELLRVLWEEAGPGPEEIRIEP
ncbi:MAG: amylo-alpha-1,6-glucosidase [Solirubrobacterales bacterium]